MMSILLPLYVYPWAGAWDPLYEAATAYPDVDFNVIVNPCSGPCVDILPDAVYLEEIPKLNAYENIRTLGYVPTEYGARDLESILADIQVYSQWPSRTQIADFRVDGIFVDETPSTYDELQYEKLERVTQTIRNGTTFKDRFIVHNPGVFPPGVLDSELVYQQSYLNLSDVTVVFEETFNKWLDKAFYDPLQSHHVDRSKLAVLLHSLPNLSKDVIDFVVEKAEDAADWIFLTDMSQNYYHSFSPLFTQMLDSVDRRGRWKKRNA